MYATYVGEVAWLRCGKTCDCARMLTVPAGRKYHSAQPVMPTLPFLNPWSLGGAVLMWECVIVFQWAYLNSPLASQADFSSHSPSGRLFPGQPSPGHTRPPEVDTRGPGGRSAVRGSPGQKVLGQSAPCHLQRGLGNDRNRAFGTRHSYYQVRQPLF